MVLSEKFAGVLLGIIIFEGYYGTLEKEPGNVTKYFYKKGAGV